MCFLFTRTRKCKKTSLQNSQKYYYDDDAENTMIDLVNDDCLAEIFMYLPVCERPKIALVCKKWKQALDYSWQSVKKLELTHWEYNECPSYLNKYPTIDGQLSFLSSLLDKCGRYITELDLTAHGHCNIVPVINESCPNLVKLQLRFKYIEHQVLVNAFSRLSKLKVLKIIFQHIENDGYIPVTIIDSLKSVAGTLRELTLSNWNEENFFKSWRFPKTFTCVIPQLKALKLIKTAGILIDTDLYMHLEHFGILVISRDNQLLHDNINRTFLYENVTKMTLMHYQATNDCLYTIANCMQQLRGLETNCERVTDAGIVAISKMNNLVHLSLCGPSQVTDSSIKLLKNLKYLNLPFSNKITDVSVMKVLENSPEMNDIYIVESSITLEFIKKAAEIVANRKTFLRMGLSYTPGLQQYAMHRYLCLIVINSSKQIVYWSINSKK